MWKILIFNSIFSKGISSFFPSPINSSESLVPLISDALETLHKELGVNLKSKIPLYAFATAGMRVLAEKNEENLIDDDEFDENDIIEEDDDDIHQSVPTLLLEIRNEIESFFQEIIIPKNSIRILSGTEEGIFGWITQQQLIYQGFHTFYQTDEFKIRNILYPEEFSMNTISHKHIGAIDFGGASTQITYWIPEPSNDIHHLSNNITGYHAIPKFADYLEHNDGLIYTHSYLHYGVYESRYSTVENAEINTKINFPLKYNQNIIIHPCLLKGSSTNHHDPLSPFILEGNSNFIECINLVRSIFNFEQDCLLAPCSFNGIHMPNIPLPHSFIAFDYATVIAGHFGYHGATSLDDLSKSIEKYCLLTWEEAVDEANKFPHLKPENDLRFTWKCYEGVYLMILFTEGYKFKNNDPFLVFTRELGKETISWALGAVISTSLQ